MRYQHKWQDVPLDEVPPDNQANLEATIRRSVELGINHIDPATMRYPENIDLWHNKYGGNTIRWIKESVAPNLKDWGFNSVGWVQEVSARQWPQIRN